MKWLIKFSGTTLRRSSQILFPDAEHTHLMPWIYRSAQPAVRCNVMAISRTLYLLLHQRTIFQISRVPLLLLLAFGRTLKEKLTILNPRSPFFVLLNLRSPLPPFVFSTMHPCTYTPSQRYRAHGRFWRDVRIPCFTGDNFEGLWRDETKVPDLQWEPGPSFFLTFLVLHICTFCFVHKDKCLQRFYIFPVFACNASEGCNDSNRWPEHEEPQHGQFHVSSSEQLFEGGVICLFARSAW